MKLVLAHGFLGNALNWMPVLRLLEEARERGELLSKNWQFQSVDLLGHGRKATRSSGVQLSLKSLAEDLEREIGDEAFVGLGHSFGVRPLLELIEMRGSALNMKALIVEDSSPTISEKGFDDLRKIFDELPETFASRKDAKECFEKIWDPRTKMPAFLLTNLTDLDGVFQWKFNRQQMKALLQNAKDHPLWGAWSQFPGRVDMILGGTSSFVPEERVQECIQRRAAGATRAHYIEGAGHWVHADQPKLFTSELVRILNEIDVSG